MMTGGDIVLDFFAGSGTTAQALMELNKEDGGNRKFILVQIDEKIDEKKSKVAYDFCKKELKSSEPKISDITIERVRRASEKIRQIGYLHEIDTGFNVYKIVEKPKILSDDNATLKLITKSELSDFDIARNLSLNSGKGFNKLEVVIENKLYKCEDSFYVVNCDDEVKEYIQKTNSEYVYISGYADIDLEMFLNLESILESRLCVVY